MHPEQTAVKHIINAPETLVAESIQGLCYANPHLRVLEKDKVVYAANADDIAKKQVTLISGGGSGHEPGYAGFTGDGMLTASVCGHVFASPSSSQVLAAIERVQSPHGTLVIIMNYTGDCLNFGLAVERAKARGIKVDLIAVGDDVAVGREKGKKVGRRGMAATVLAIKLAGAAAVRGASLEQVRTIAQYAIDNSATLGVALDHCHVPGSGSFNQLEANELELGMGIHNEAGFLKTKMMEAKPLVQKMMGMLTDQQDTDRSYISLPKEETSRVVLLVNNLGGTALVELNLVVKEAVEALLEKKSSIKLERVYVGCFVTSLNMPGFSLSLLKIQGDEQLSLLDEKVHVTGWPLTAALSFSEKVVGEEIKTNSSSTETQSDGNAGQVKDPKVLEAAIRGATQAVIDAEPRITDFDTILGDGDCGQTLKTAALAIQEGLSTYNLKSAPETILGIADTIEHSVGGTSSAIYCIFMNAFAAGLLKTNKDAQVDQTAWIKASRFALDTLMTYTKARIGDRTLMDTLCPFVDTLNETEDVNAALEAARKGSEKTKDLSAKLGRSSYLDNKDVIESGIPDAGAYGLAELLTGMVNTLQ